MTMGVELSLPDSRGWRCAGLAVLLLSGTAIAMGDGSEGVVGSALAPVLSASSVVGGEDSLFRQLLHVLTLRDYNTRVVVIGTALLGMAAGISGTFAYLRKRALMGDALSHATLPGIAIAFLLVGGKSLGWLILGAACTGVLGVVSVIGIRRFSRIKEDAAIGIVLSVFFGVGMVLFSVIQQRSTGHEAGLRTFIYGKAASMIARDAWLIGGAAVVVIIGTVALFKEFRVICFDQSFAGSIGRSVVVLDLAMMSLVVLTTVVGLQAVGLIMIVALLIIPAGAARFWTDGLVRMTVLAALFGAVSGWIGSTISALWPRMPTGAVIVVTAGGLFAFSMLAAPRRGVMASVIRRWLLRRKIGYQNLLRALAEFEEARGSDVWMDVSDLRTKRSWSASMLRLLMIRARRRGHLVADYEGRVRLTASGRTDGHRVLRNHRLWELYLIKYAAIAPSHVDRDADEIEHVLTEEVVRELRQLLAERAFVPVSPHGQEGAT